MLLGSRECLEIILFSKQGRQPCFCIHMYQSAVHRDACIRGGAREFASGGLASCGLLIGAGCYVYLVYTKDPFIFLYFIDNGCNCFLISKFADSDAPFSF